MKSVRNVSPTKLSNVRKLVLSPSSLSTLKSRTLSLLQARVSFESSSLRSPTSFRSPPSNLSTFPKVSSLPPRISRKLDRRSSNHFRRSRIRSKMLSPRISSQLTPLSTPTSIPPTSPSSLVLQPSNVSRLTAEPTALSQRFSNTSASVPQEINSQ